MPRYALEIVSDNVTTEEGDSLLVEFSNPLRRFKRLNYVLVDTDPAEDAVDAHDVEVRWSHDSRTWSAWVPHVTGGTVTNPFPDIIRGGRDFYLQARATRRAGGTDAPMSLTGVTISYEAGPRPEGEPESPFADGDCSASACPTENACTGVIATCDPSLVFRVYDHMGPAVKMFQEVSCAVSEMLGHCVRYFRVTPDAGSGDPTLHEYTVFDATDVKDVKAMVPDNQLPNDGSLNYIPFDMDFQEGLELHIVPEHFERAFGQGTRPQEKDFVYFPLMDRLFEVHSSYLHRGFMHAPDYHRVMLYKWQDRDNVLKDRARPEIGEYVDDLTTDFEEVLRGDIEENTEDLTNPQQYRTFLVGGYDHVRSQIHEDLEIVEQDIESYFTLVAKYHYKMNTVPVGHPAVVWKHSIAAGPTDSTALSMWVRPDPGTTTGTHTVVSGEGGTGAGLSVLFHYGGTGPTGAQGYVHRIQVASGGATYNFNGLPADLVGRWTGLVLNVMPDFDQVQLSLWSVRPKSAKTTELRLDYSRALDYPGGPLGPNAPMRAPGGPHRLTNVRVWRAAIEEEKQSLVLSQYVVKDSHLAALIDNAVPPLRLPKTYVR